VFSNYSFRKGRKWVYGNATLLACKETTVNGCILVLLPGLVHYPFCTQNLGEIKPSSGISHQLLTHSCGGQMREYSQKFLKG
jgi:hypothetical protein